MVLRICREERALFHITEVLLSNENLVHFPVLLQLRQRPGSGTVSRLLKKASHSLGLAFRSAVCLIERLDLLQQFLAALLAQLLVEGSLRFGR